MSSQELYEAELKQSNIDHHTPTAGAMTGHIIANLLLHSLTISQATLFAKGKASLFLAEYGPKWIAFEQDEFKQLNRILVNEGEAIPTTLDQFKEYTMIQEDGADKYSPGEEQLFNLVKDFDTQILFINKAIILAKNAEWFELETNLIHLHAWIKEQIRVTQRFLGHDLREGLYVEDDDDDDF